MAKAPVKIPFEEDGSQMAYTSASHDELPSYSYASGSYQKAGEWRDNYEFEATLTVESMERGRSAARFILRDEHGRRFTMFMTDMLELIQTAELIAYGHIDGRWTFQKRGANYGIKLIGSRG